MATIESTKNASNVEAVIRACRNIVHKKRVRVSEFFADFDRLRSGLVHPNHFISALSMAGINQTALSGDDMDALKENYCVSKSGSADMVDYKAFCADMDRPIEEEPITSNQICGFNTLNISEQDKVNELLSHIAKACQHKGILVKPTFVDFANNNNSTKLVGHVTKHQFHRVLDCKIGIKASEEDVCLLSMIYSHPQYTEMVNYVAFSNDVQAEEAKYDPYGDA